MTLTMRTFGVFHHLEPRPQQRLLASHRHAILRPTFSHQHIAVTPTRSYIRLDPHNLVRGGKCTPVRLEGFLSSPPE